MKIRFSNIIWGTFLLLAAAFLLFNQFDGFTNIGVGSIIVTVIAVLFIVQCISALRFAPLPIPIAVLYIIFQTPLSLPEIQTRTIIIASILTTIGLLIMLPGKRFFKHRKYKIKKETWDHSGRVQTEDSINENNPSASVQFGSISRRLHADNLETINLYCNFGELEIFFDQVKLNPNGAEANINCSFGAIKLFIPKDWLIIDKLNCPLGGVDISKNFAVPAENAPRLILNGSVSFGGIEVRYI